MRLGQKNPRIPRRCSITSTRSADAPLPAATPSLSSTRPDGTPPASLPANVSLLELPPKSPELNPAENLWQFLRQTKLSDRIFDGYDAIVTAACQAWNTLIADPARITSIRTGT